MSLLRQAADRNEIPAWHAAMLEDRIRMFEGKPQIYGSQFRPDENGQLVPSLIQDPEGVDARREAVGFDTTVEERMLQLREQASQEKTQPPEGWKKYEEQYEKWLRSVGWRK